MATTPRRRSWQDELAIIDRTMKAISGVSDPDQLVQAYWTGIGDLVPIEDYIALSRRNVEPPFYLITRSSHFTERFNPWTQRERLPRLSGGILGEIAYANRPVIIDDLRSRLKRDDPAFSYLEGFEGIIALPQYDEGESLNVTAMLLRQGAQFDRAMIPMMHWQASLFGRGTQNLVLRNQLAGAVRSLDREMQVVGEIQRSLLPSRLPQIAGFELAAHYVTSARAGGDYYDFFPLCEGRWGLFIADVSGHGTPAAVLMAITHALAHARPGTHAPPAALLKYLNEQLVQSYTRGGTFVTAFYAVLDPARRRLTYSAGGHNPPRLARGGTVLPLDAAGAFPLGIAEDTAFTEEVLELVPGDLLLLYTDGITEAMAARAGASPELFGLSRLDAILHSPCVCSAPQCIARIREELTLFSGEGPPRDDQTLVAMRCS